jgi:Rieske Fe-S protein
MNYQEVETVDRSKRNFLTVLLGGSLLAWIGSVLFPILSFLKAPKQAEVEVRSVKVGTLGDIEKDSGMIVRFGNKPVILVRTPEDELKAFDGTCTHLDCTVQYRKDMGVIWCACHNGKYDLTGRNIAGPPPRPLEAYRVVIQGDEVYVAKQS